MFLTDAEVEELTGYVQIARQVKWLKRNGIRFFRQRLTGRVIVAREALLSKSKGGEDEGPRLDWIKNRGKRKAA